MRRGLARAPTAGRHACLALALLGPLYAGAVEPWAQWETIESPHFRVHYPRGPGMAPLAQRTARTCERAHERLVPLLGTAPAGKTDVILTDDADTANGSATAYQRPVITALADPPDDLSVLHDYDDYLWALLAHEYTHVLHLGLVGGLPSLFNRVFGQLWIPNAVAPRWLVEGLATYQESAVSAAGRNRSSLFDMWLRAQVLEGTALRLDELSQPLSRWPRGHAAYLYGGRFVEYVARRVGADRLRDYLHSYGQQPVPFALNVTARRTLGVDFVALYGDWQEELRRGYRDQLEELSARGLTQVRTLTLQGEGTGHPTFGPGGRLFYLEAGPNRPAALRSMRPDGADDRLELELQTAALFALHPNGKAAVLSRAQVYQEFATFDDLYWADFESRAVRQLTFGLRATEPALSRDGHRVAFVARAGGGATWLGVLHLLDGRLERLLDASPDERIFTPAFDADDQAIVFSQQRGSARHVRRHSSRGVETLVGDDALNLEPRAMANGTILFSSDRSGIFNAFAYRPDGTVETLTNVATGVFHPALSADGHTLAVTTFSSRGYDVGVVELVGQRPALPSRPARPPPPPPDDPTQRYAERPYSPWRSVLPTFWLPLAGSDPRGPTLGALTGGGDLTERHRWAASAGAGLVSGQPSASFGYTAKLTWPTLELSGTTQVFQAAGFAQGTLDRQWSATAAATFAHTRVESWTSIRLAYDLVAYVPLHGPAPFGPDTISPTLPRRGTANTLGLSWAVSNARGYADSISAEEGQTLWANVRYTHRALGGSFTALSADAAWQGYRAVPFLSHHVVAARLAAGASRGDLGGRRVYSLGGLTLDDPVVQLLRREARGAGYLRGFAPRALSGNTFALANLEYRFPLAVIDRGAQTLPLFLRRVHGAVTTDVGAVGPGEGLTLGAPRFCLGLELRAELYLAYYLGADLKLGYSKGFGAGGRDVVYATVGPSF